MMIGLSNSVASGEAWSSAIARHERMFANYDTCKYIGHLAEYCQAVSGAGIKELSSFQRVVCEHMRVASLSSDVSDCPSRTWLCSVFWFRASSCRLN